MLFSWTLTELKAGILGSSVLTLDVVLMMGIDKVGVETSFSRASWKIGLLPSVSEDVEEERAFCRVSAMVSLAC